MRSIPRLSVLVSAAALTAFTPHAALADDFVDRANDLVRQVPSTQSVDGILFPKIAAMDGSPVPVASSPEYLRQMSLLGPEYPRWQSITEWAAAAPQQAVLEALEDATSPTRRPLLTTPYGAEAADPDLVEANLYVELGPAGLLTPLEPRYLDAFAPVHALVVWDAVRLAEAGEGDAGLDHYLGLIRFYRLVMDRPSKEEQLRAYELMGLTLEQLRDFVYQYRYDDTFESGDVIELISALNNDELEMDQVRVPTLTRVAGDQFIDRFYELEGDVLPGPFSQVMPTVEARTEPLQLFNSVAVYRQLAAYQRDWYEVKDQMDRVIGDFEARWKYGLNDIFHVTVPTDYSQTNHQVMKVVEVVGEGLDRFRPYRKAMLVHLAGTRLSLAGAAYMMDNDGNLPPALVSLQPRYIDRLTNNLDLFSIDYDAQREEDFLYLKPREVARQLINSGDPLRMRRGRQLDRPHPLEINFPYSFTRLLGGAVRGESGVVPRQFDWSAAYESAEGNVATGPTANFEPRWNRDFGEDDRRRDAIDRSIIGQPAFSLPFYDSFAREQNTNALPGEIVVVFPGGGAGGRRSSGSDAGYDGSEVETFSRIGREFVFDGVRVVAVGSNYAEDGSTAEERRIQAAAWARRIPINLYFHGEDWSVDERLSSINLQETNDDAIIIDRNGIVRAVGIRYRYLEDAIVELLREQPAEALAWGPAADAWIDAVVGERPFPIPTSFRAEVDEDDFILWSRGINGRDDNPSGVDQAHPIDSSGRELLFWPPVLSLQRNEMLSN